ncbi:MAG: hypothetical protein N5P05_000660 [Chroococcopsis gigantea SAG 12.99]|jgi:1-acyl-sn-glycerol-3-phosphate acyltransferase|nr:1-acyl-sn-glycerol-3-phosphate acyltransferase [Chlorogloea purpurea SAG 13.99]MDV2999054.1 hypothetical protein [Chroococcopsis gigantea SAG 12.99]
MSLLSPLASAQLILDSTRTNCEVFQRQNIPMGGSTIVISNHRSFLDAPILINALRRPVRIACHHYMGQTPGLKQMIDALGCFPLDAPQQRQERFFQRARGFLEANEWVGLFPEGGSPMIHLTNPKEMTSFHRGFAHLALRCPLEKLAVLPVAILSEDESVISPFPVRFLRLFDPTEPLFDQDAWHPVVIYHRVKVYIGRPYWITDAQRANYSGKQGKRTVTEITDYCVREISTLLNR